MNNFSILASDVDESPGLCCTSKLRSCGDERGAECRRGAERVDERRRGNERVDECITAPETKFPSHRRPSTSKVNAHSYLAASGGHSKGVHHVSGDG